LIAPEAPVRIENDSAAVSTTSTQIQNSDFRLYPSSAIVFSPNPFYFQA
jgi:hypothetical protein